MNLLTRLLGALLLVCLLHCSTLLYVSPFPAGIDVHDVTHIEIHYAVDPHMPSHGTTQFYEIERKNDTFFSKTRKKIDSNLIELLLSSLTDLYESEVYEEGYDGFFMTSYYPHFEVIITLQDESQILMKSDSNYHCWIPWNVTYDGKTYVQYNGEIPSALAKILAAVGKGWSQESELVQCGCYPAPAPERYAEEGITPDFPASKHVMTIEEHTGMTHLLWNMDVESIMMVSPLFIESKVVVLTSDTVMVLIPETGKLLWETTCGEIASKPVYANGSLFISTTEKVMALDFETGRIEWQDPIQGGSNVFSSYPHELLLYEDLLFVGVKGPGVYSIDIYTGDIVWKYFEEGPNRACFHMVGNTLIVRSTGVRAFDASTGEMFWEIPEFLYNVEVSEDKILVRTLEGEKGFFWSLLQAQSGEVLWKSSIKRAQSPLYHDGMLYFGDNERNLIVCLDIQLKREVWSYPFHDTLDVIEIIGDAVAFNLYDEREPAKRVSHIVFLDSEGNLIWEHTFHGGVLRLSDSILDRIYPHGDVLFFFRGGAIEALAVKTGDLLWSTYVRDLYVSIYGRLNLSLHGNALYVTSQASRLYCIDAKTGVILWYYRLEREIWYAPGIINALIPEVEDNLIAVATRRGGIFLFSHDVDSGQYISSESGPRPE